MKSSAALLLGVLSVAAAAPFGIFPNNQATGNAGANVVSGFNQTPYGNSRITQNSAYASGSSRGNGYSQNNASGQQLSSSGPYGNQEYSNTNANSNINSYGNGYRPFGRRFF